MTTLDEFGFVTSVCIVTLNMPQNVSVQLSSARWYASASDEDPADVDQNFNSWKNITDYTEIELANYVERYFYYWYLFKIWLLTVGIIKCIAGIMGFVGYVLETYVMLKSSHFHAVSYVYHKAIIIAEFPVMFIVLQQAVCNFLPSETVGVFIMDLVVSYPISDLLGSTADMITVFMSLERALQLWTPKSFVKFNQRWIAWLCVFASFVSSAIVNLPDTLAETAFKTAAGRLWLGKTEFGETQIYVNFSVARDILNLFKGVSIIVLAIVVEIGLVKMTKSSYKLSSDKPNLEFSRQLCILNLSCSIPVTIHAILYVIYFKYLNETIMGSQALQLPFEEAQGEITKALWCMLENLFLDISYLVSHCCHFYLYYALSTSFRHSAKKHLCKRNQVRSTTDQTANT